MVIPAAFVAGVAAIMFLAQTVMCVNWSRMRAVDRANNAYLWMESAPVLQMPLAWDWLQTVSFPMSMEVVRDPGSVQKRAYPTVTLLRLF